MTIIYPHTNTLVECKNLDLLDGETGYMASWFSYECYSILQEDRMPVDVPAEDSAMDSREGNNATTVVPTSVEVTSQTGSTTFQKRGRANTFWFAHARAAFPG